MWSAKLEKLSVADTLRAVRFAHVAILVLDANEKLEKQDLQIARLVHDEGRVLIIAANKWDSVEDKVDALKMLKRRVEFSLPQVRDLPVITVSARTGQNLSKLLDAALESYKAWNRRIPTAELNRWLGAMLEANPPPLVDGRRLKIRYMTQVKTRPPTFSLFASKPDGSAGILRALSDRRHAPALQAARHPHPLPAAQGQESVRQGRRLSGYFGRFARQRFCVRR